MLIAHRQILAVATVFASFAVFGATRPSSVHASLVSTPRALLLVTGKVSQSTVQSAVMSMPKTSLPIRPSAAMSVKSPGRLAIARLQYDGGGDWYANPSSIPNLLRAIAERTALPVERTEGRVRLTDSAVFDYPFLHVTGHGEIKFSTLEIERLREYLKRGGFLHVDDNYGLDESFRREIARVFPDRPLIDVPRNHPIYHIVYDMPSGPPKIHEHDGKPAQGLGIFIGNRLAVYYTYSADLGNGWEDVGTYPDPPAAHEQALRMGINLFTYAATSRVTP
ncbi:MAG: DUF4159 domain-containing protein [Gemmatimonas sp.]